MVFSFYRGASVGDGWIIHNRDKTLTQSHLNEQAYLC